MYISMCWYTIIAIIIWVLSIYSFIKHYTIIIANYTTKSYTHIYILHMQTHKPVYMYVYYMCNIIGHVYLWRSP